jgi:Uncharacterised nucleotidyltransferase
MTPTAALARTDRRELLTTALREPASAARWPVADLSLLLHQARRAGLLGRLADRMGGCAGAHWPPALEAHFEAARRVTRAQQAEIRREAAYLAAALLDIDVKVVLLKGAAYVVAGLPAASGRVFGDIDIMVPRAALDAVEARLSATGWVSTHTSAYDQRFYREWMHELPPMAHSQRGTSLDVHHAIVPLTARLKPDAASMFARAVPVPGQPKLFVLAPDDMLLHSMTHLFMNDDTRYALRDLSDLDLLLRHFAEGDPGFWTRLIERAAAQGLGRPLHDAVGQLRRLMATPVPAAAWSAMEQRFARPQPLRSVMQAIWTRVIRSPHPSTARPGAALALGLLYVRGHWLRMPPWLLARHLTIKALRRHEETGPAAARTVG